MVHLFVYDKILQYMWPYNQTTLSESGSDSCSEEDSTYEEQEESDEDSTSEDEPFEDVTKLPYHVHVSFLLCPQPKVIEHAKNQVNCDPEDWQACERLIKN